MTYKFRTAGPRHVAIVGSRHLTNYRDFSVAVRSLLRPTDIIVSGGAAGIDSLASRYARQNGHRLIEHLPDQKLVAQKQSEGLGRDAAYGFAAFARNTLVVDQPGADLMIAIRCPHSRGTWDTIAKMKRRIADVLELTGTGGRGAIYLYHYLWECDPARRERERKEKRERSK